MPFPFVLKDRDNKTISEVIEYSPAAMSVCVRRYGELVDRWKPISDLTIVPRAELLAGQVAI